MSAYNNITIYKIGLDNYVQNCDVVDKNGGLFEYNIIATELQDVKTAASVLIIVNGKFCKDEEQRLLSYMSLFQKVIFIASDIIAFEENTKIIENCDYLLHQSSTGIVEKFDNIKQSYSWLPELFYKYVKRIHVTDKVDKVDKIIFGGGVRDNESKIISYLSSVPSSAYLKTDAYDNRLQYDEYIKQLSKHKYSLIISRKSYVELDWITPRYIEALAVNTLPLCDSTYDRLNHFGAIKVFNANDLRAIMFMFNTNDMYLRNVLSNMQQQIEKNTCNFKNLVLALIGEKQ